MTLKVSFEIFPPRTEKSEASLYEALDQLAPLEPEFVSMTYGAGGSSRDVNNRILKELGKRKDFETAAHVTCVGQSKAEIDELIETWMGYGIKRFVALRGDMPEPGQPYKPHPEGYENTADLVEVLAKRGAKDISVGCYPEVHPDSPSQDADIEHLKSKVDAGATRAISQFFFDVEAFLRFRDKAEKAGINVPLVPGVLPVHDYHKMVRFANMCGAIVPEWVGQRFEGLDDDPETRGQVGAIIAAELCSALQAEGVDRFHFYTLNRAPLTHAVCRQLGIQPRLEEEEAA